ncbi:hypothetical protein Efla_005527 [Eimeria flavescens]
MWRACGVSYARYTAEMAELLRKYVCRQGEGGLPARPRGPAGMPPSRSQGCVKEPYRTQLQNKNMIHLKEAVYKQGSVVSRETYEQLKAAFEACEAAAKKAE